MNEQMQQDLASLKVGTAEDGVGMVRTHSQRMLCKCRPLFVSSHWLVGLTFGLPLQVESKASESSAAIAKLETQIGDKQRNMIKVLRWFGVWIVPHACCCCLQLPTRVFVCVYAECVQLYGCKQRSDVG